MNLAVELRAWADHIDEQKASVARFANSSAIRALTPHYRASAADTISLLRDAAKALDDLTAENERLRETTCADHSLRIHRLVEANSDLIRNHNALLRDGGRWQTRAEVAEAQVRAVLALVNTPRHEPQCCDQHHAEWNALCDRDAEIRAAIDKAGNGYG